MQNQIVFRRITSLEAPCKLSSFAVEAIVPVPVQKPKKKVGRKRTKLSKIELLLTNLPTGVTFIGPAGFCTEEYIMS